MITVGINAGFGAPLAAEFAGLAAHWFGVVRVDVYANDDPKLAPPLIGEWAGAPLRPLFLVGGGHIQHRNGYRIDPSELAAWTALVVDTAAELGVTDYLIEIGNEPDIAHPGYSNAPRAFARAVSQCAETARAHGFTGPILSGGVANLDERGLAYLANLTPLHPDVVVGFHRYPPSGRGPLATHLGFYADREEEWDALLAVTRGRPLACTEFGYHTAEERFHTRTDAEVASSVLWELDFFERHGVSLACVYQLNDGPGDTWLDKFGVRTVAGVWKPVATEIQATYGPT